MYICEQRNYEIHWATLPYSKPAKHKKKYPFRKTKGCRWREKNENFQFTAKFTETLPVYTKFDRVVELNE